MLRRCFFAFAPAAIVALGHLVATGGEPKRDDAEGYAWRIPECPIEQLGDGG